MLTLYSLVRRPLTISEVDTNFSDLQQRILDFEARGLSATGLLDIEWDEVAGTVELAYDDGLTIGPIPLPTTFFATRGEWEAGALYRLRDLVSRDGSSYAARAAHTAGPSFDDDVVAGRWQLVSKRGRDAFQSRGVYNATVVYEQADSVSYQPVAGGPYVLYRLCNVPAGGLPAGTAPGARDAAGVPYWLPVTQPVASFDMRAYVGGKPTSLLQILHWLAALPFKLPANLAGATFTLAAPPAAAYKLTIYKSTSTGPTILGSVDFAVGATTGVVTMPETSFAAGDVFDVVAPSTPDTAAQGLTALVVGVLL